MYYKLVNNSLCSITGHSSYPDTYIQYKRMEWVKPKYEVAPLCVFSSLEAVHKFKDYFGWAGKIFECSILKSHRTWQNMCQEQEITALMKGEPLVSQYPYMDWPAGTILADQVMLIKGPTEKKSKIYYKVLKNNNSASGESLLYGLSVNYKIDEWTVPKLPEAPLMVFEDKEVAIPFCKILQKHNSLQEYTIHRCEIIKSRKKWGYIHDSDLFDAILELKRQKKKVTHLYSPEALPKGTVLADAVKLLGKENVL